jgi:cholesterol transport system auxiliary component
MRAYYACSIRAGALFGLIFLALSGCGTLKPDARPTIYDFGPGPLASLPAQPSPPLPALAFVGVQATSALDSTAVLYRLNYSDSQQLRPYTQARWSMPPAEMLRQRTREQLGRRRPVLNPTDGVVAAAPPLILRLELEEFSQLFDSPNSSVGLIRLRATLGQTNARGPGPEQLVAQRSFVVQHPSATQDARGGVRALSVAVDTVIQELEAWVQQNQKAAP